MEIVIIFAARKNMLLYLKNSLTYKYFIKSVLYLTFAGHLWVSLGSFCYDILFSEYKKVELYNTQKGETGEKDLDKNENDEKVLPLLSENPMQRKDLYLVLCEHISIFSIHQIEIPTPPPESLLS